LADVPYIKVNSYSVIACADVTSLYPSIPIDFGLAAMKQFLTSVQFVSPQFIDFVLALLEWVLRNNFLQFKGIVYHQLTGTAMGTPVAPTYANLVLRTIEAPLLASLQPSYYRRYIDDIFGTFNSKAHATEFFQRFNEACPAIQLEAITIGASGVMLDLYLRIDTTTDGNTTIYHSLYQKPANKYQYIPTLSEHQPSVFSNFITAELSRYLLCCSCYVDFIILLARFRMRLRARGYHDEMLVAAFKKLPHRSMLVEKLPATIYLSLTPTPYSTSDLVSLPSVSTLNPTPVTLPNLNPRLRRPVITVYLPRMQYPIRWHNILRIPTTLWHVPEFNTVYGGDPIVGSKNPPSIAMALTSEAKPDEEHGRTHKRQRRALSPPVPYIL
jgi:hypothetical protein